MCMHLVPFLSYSASNNGVTLKSGLRITQDQKMVLGLFESLDTVSYSSSIATMVVYLAVSEIISVK